MTILLESISCDIESNVMSIGRLPRQFTYTRLVNGSPSICRDLSCLGYDGQSMTHTGDIIVHRPLRVDRFTGLIHVNSVHHSAGSSMDLVKVDAVRSQLLWSTVEILLEAFYGMKFVSVNTMYDYFGNCNITLSDLVKDGALKYVPMENYRRYAEYFTPMC